MKLHILIFVLFATLHFSCKEEVDLVCSVRNPIEDLPWLADDIQEMKQSGLSQYLYVTRAIYKSNPVFIYANCCPYCNSITSVYDCSGNEIGVIGDGKDDVPPSILDHDIVIWRADNFACTL